MSQIIKSEMGFCQPCMRSEVKTTVTLSQLMMKQNKKAPPLHFTTTHIFPPHFPNILEQEGVS